LTNYFLLTVFISLSFIVFLSIHLIDPLLNNHQSASADTQPSTLLLFKKIVTANDGSRYLIGEVQNNETSKNIESVTYFSRATSEPAYYSQDIGVVPTGMGIPFKINIQDVEKSVNSPFNLSDFKIVSRYTHDETNSLLAVNYSSLNTDPSTHALNGTVGNNSPISAYNVQVLAIALDSHSKPLDVVKSNIIPTIMPGGVSSFRLVPIDSIAKDVKFYSCFVPTAVGLNYTVPAGNGQNMQLLFGGDGKMKNIQYDPENRNLTFIAEGIFPGGGSEEAMILSGPDSFTKSDLILTVNGQNVTNGVAGQIVGGKVYKHIDFSFPFGDNVVSVKAVSEVPEFPIAPEVTVASVAAVILATTIFVRTQIRK
jgi:hypothetical protein